MRRGGEPHFDAVEVAGYFSPQGEFRVRSFVLAGRVVRVNRVTRTFTLAQLERQVVPTVHLQSDDGGRWVLVKRAQGWLAGRAG